MDEPEAADDVRAERFAADSERNGHDDAAEQRGDPARAHEIPLVLAFEEAGHPRHVRLDAEDLVGEECTGDAEGPVLHVGATAEIEEGGFGAEGGAEKRREQPVRARLSGRRTHEEGDEQGEG
jgi:hypothetical protein